jgi:hypothetical protein
MHLLVLVNDTRLRALLDLGSTHNFINTTAAALARVTLCSSTGLRVVVAKGDHVMSSGCVRTRDCWD